MNVHGHRFLLAVIVLSAIVLWFVQITPTHADTSASSSASVPGMDAVPSVADILSTIRRVSAASNAESTVPTSGASSSGSVAVPGNVDLSAIFSNLGGLISGASSTASTSTAGLGSSIVDTVQGVLGATASSTGLGGTSGLGSQIADAITGGVNGTSNFGPFIKCGLIGPIGWPLPSFSTECNASTTDRARLTIIKQTVGGDGSFDFEISGSGSASTTITTSGGSGSVQFLASPGTFDIAELARDGWTQASRGCASQHATSTGGASGNLGWSILLNAGDDIVCTFVNTVSATTTPGGGGGCTANCGGGGNPGGGGTPGGGSSGGGGGGGGGNGPILGGGGFSPGEVLGNTISNPELPGVPNTGAGDATGTLLVLIASLSVACVGLLSLRRSA